MKKVGEIKGVVLAVLISRTYFINLATKHS